MRERRRRSRVRADSALHRSKARQSGPITERKKELTLASEFYELLDEMDGLFMTHLSSLPAKIGGRDPAMRRKVEPASTTCGPLSNEAAKRANERGEPPEPLRFAQRNIFKSAPALPNPLIGRIDFS